MTLLKDLNSHKKDLRITFIEENHKYILDENPTKYNLISCSTYIKYFFGNFETEKILDKIQCKIEYMNDRSYKYYRMSREDILKSWEEKRQLGTNLHKHIENYLNNIDTSNEYYKPEFNYFLKFQEDFKNLWEIYRTEWIVYIDTLEIAGTIDAVYKIKGSNEFVIIDWKRVDELNFKSYNENKGYFVLSDVDDCNYRHYCLQLSLYRYILETEYEKKVVNMFLIVLHPNNVTYKKIEVQYMKEEIKSILSEEMMKYIKKNTIKTNTSTIETGLSPKQNEAYRLMERGDNIFLTAAGGYGKTFLLMKFINSFSFRRKIGVTSTTGTSAILLNGSTLHSFLGIGLGKDSVENLLLHIKSRSYLNKRWKELETLIIDEISMLSPVLFDKLELLARSVRYNDKPFGGIQLILSGDFLQLPNVDDNNMFCFDAKSWSDCISKSNIIHLDENFRQDDTELQKCLQEVRYGELSEESIALLKSRENVLLENDLGILPTRIYSLNSNVDYENQKNLDKLFENDSSLTYYEYELSYEVSPHATNVVNIEDRIKKSCNAPTVVQLCKGAQVMLLYNLDIEMKLVNGSRGVVVDFIDDFPVVKFLNGESRLICNHAWSITDKNKTIVTIEQIPLRVAYAVTVHKCQGITIDLAEIDLKGFFEYGQAYVALSRVRTLNGLSLRNFDKSYIKAHPRVVKYYKNI